MTNDGASLQEQGGMLRSGRPHWGLKRPLVLDNRLITEKTDWEVGLLCLHTSMSVG